LALELENNTLLDYKYMMTENGKEIQKNSQYCNKTAKYSSNRQILEQTLSKKNKKGDKKDNKNNKRY
jgi:hypothetical protein